MKRIIITLFLCALLFLTLTLSASAEMLEDPDIADPGSLPAALSAKDRNAVLEALKGDLNGNGVIVDLNTFNALVITPAEKFDDMYGAMPNIENRAVIGVYENENAGTTAAVSKDSRNFIFNPPEGTYRTEYLYVLSADLGNLRLSEREPLETDIILDKALLVRERGFYDIRGKVCSACGTYNAEPQDHCVLPCGVHMSCIYDKNDISHYAVCTECRRMACSCYCNNYLSGKICLAVSGSGEYAVAGHFHDRISLSFDKGAKVEYIGLKVRTVADRLNQALEATLGASVQENADSAAKPEFRPKIEVTPDYECVVCKAVRPVPQGVPLACGSHYVCPGCESKMTPDRISAHGDMLECGHFTCDGRKHSVEIFSENCTADPKHHKCEGETGIHHCPSCGKDYPCEEARNHVTCIFCWNPLCNGRMHGYGICG